MRKAFSLGVREAERDTEAEVLEQRAEEPQEAAGGVGGGSPG